MAVVGSYSMRRATVAEVPLALGILREAVVWASERGTPVWAMSELLEDDFVSCARDGELVLGYDGTTPVATMLLQSSDALYWPDAAPNSAVYLHKVAVSRASAGQGWLGRLIDFATHHARARGIGLLRLDTLARPVMRDMYERHGFTIIPEEPLLIHGRRIIRMQRNL